MNKLGIIGGMGSEATSYFFKEIINHTKAEKDQDHIDTIILNHASIPDRTEAILTNKNKKEVIEKLINDSILLEKLGVENIAIPCNTSHYFYDEIQEKIQVPIINMIEETIIHILDNKVNTKKIGLMATTGTVKSKLYQKKCEKYNLDIELPSEDRQIDIMSLIYDDIKRGHSANSEKFNRVYNELLDNGCDVIILACTELSVFYKANNLKKQNKICLDAMDILVKESIIRSNAIYK